MEILHKYFRCKKVEKTNDYKNEKNNKNTKKTGLSSFKFKKIRKKFEFHKKQKGNKNELLCRKI